MRAIKLQCRAYVSVHSNVCIELKDGVLCVFCLTVSPCHVIPVVIILCCLWSHAMCCCCMLLCLSL